MFEGSAGCHQENVISQGRDGLPPVVYEYGGKKLALKILELFKPIWKVGRIPQSHFSVLMVKS